MNHIHSNARYYCLAYKTQADGSRELDEITRAEWKQIVSQNKGKTGEERRYFTEEFNEEDDGGCWFICEVSHEEYRAWNAAYKKHTRSEEVREEKYQVVSFDAPAYQDDNGETILNSEMIADPNADTARDGEWLVKSAQFRHGIENWREWGPELLAYHEAGMGRSCTTVLAEEHDCCAESVRYRKRAFRAESLSLCKRYGIGNFD